MLLETTHEQLLWPTRQQILEPDGAGPGVYARLANKKLGNPIRFQGADVQVGILAANPSSETSEAPLAVVCEFQRPVSPGIINSAHELAWSFSRTPLLITVEPHLLRVWTCYEPPVKAGIPDQQNPLLMNLDYDSGRGVFMQPEEAQALNWMRLITGDIFRKHAPRFKAENRADQMLLQNLLSVRSRLSNLGLDMDLCHDLLARIIFIQFLFDRKDSDGRPALNRDVLASLHEQSVLSAPYENFAEILRSHDDSYSLFRWLNSKFNGDLFPGCGGTEKEQQTAWQAEIEKVEPKHLELLADFVSGEMEMETGQKCLWPYYSFDAIPLDFISSIYEIFLGEEGEARGAYYTPGHIADFMLDGVLPWAGNDWDKKILDPACGSGIFLVKAYQRLIQRWKNANPGQDPKANVLKKLLENNLFGVDIDKHAVRVASFSMYLAMCDEIDPKHYWKLVRFPRLRGQTLIDKDFFSEDVAGIRTNEDRESYDLIVGNAPWGRNTIKQKARKWAGKEWRPSYGNVGPLFLLKAASLTKPSGRVSMVQPANNLLFNKGNTAVDFRKKFFSRFKVDEIVNLSALRFGLFSKAVDPSCLITLRPGPPDGEPLTYICPTLTLTSEDDYMVMIEPHDINFVYPEEAIDDPDVWTTLMWGGRRDLVFLRSLRHSFQNLQSLKTSGVIKTRLGLKRGDRLKKDERLLGRRVQEEKRFPEGTFMYLDPKDLAFNEDPWVHSRESTDLTPFELPQLLVKSAYQQRMQRFRSVMVRSRQGEQGVLCSYSYLAVHASRKNRDWLETACLVLNSDFAVYYLLLTSGRMAAYRQEARAKELLQVPLPDAESGLLANIQKFEDVDKRIRQVFSFKESEWILIDDLTKYALPGLRDRPDSPGHQATHQESKSRNVRKTEPILTAYCEWFIRVLRAGFGQDRRVSATIYQQDDDIDRLPVRIVVFYLDGNELEPVQLNVSDKKTILKRIETSIRTADNDPRTSTGFSYRPIMRLYMIDEQDGRRLPCVALVKPDQARYWTRSMAMRDADEVAEDIIMWQQESRPPSETESKFG